MNADRLGNVARALRESVVKIIDVDRYVDIHCGTPSCALGHYAARTDLQALCVIAVKRYDADGGPIYGVVYNNGAMTVLNFDDPAVKRHFELNDYEAAELFGIHGCGGAHTLAQAADYIEEFITRKQREGS